MLSISIIVSVVETEYGYRYTKDVNAGARELRILMSKPDLLECSYYITIHSDEDHIIITDTMRSSEYDIRLVDFPEHGDIIYIIGSKMTDIWSKKVEMRINIEQVSDLKSRLIIEARKLDMKLGAQMAMSAAFMPEDQMEGITAVTMELTIFTSIIEAAIQSQIPYIRDAYVVKGDLVGSKVEITDSVVNRSSINVDNKFPEDADIRSNTRVDQKISVNDSQMNRSQIGVSGTSQVSIDDSVINRSEIAQGADNHSLETYKETLKKALADGDIGESEDAMLKVLREGLGITPEQHRELMRKLSGAQGKQLQTYRQVLKEAMRDGVVQPSEEAMLAQLRMSLGISKDQHEKLLKEFKK